PQLMRQIFSPKLIGAGASSARPVLGATRLTAGPSSRRHLAEAVGGARGIALHGLDQHVAADRTGGRAARHALLDDYGTRTARLVGGAEADEQRVMAQVPRQHRLGDAHVALALGDALYLRRAGLAGETELRFEQLALGIDAQRVGGAEARVHHREHAVADDRE